MSMGKDPFKALREKLRKKKEEEEKAKAGRAPSAPGPTPPPKPAPQPAGRQPADRQPAGRQPEVEHASRKGGVTEMRKKKVDALPPPKGFVRHHFALEDVSKMKGSKARFKPEKPKKFDDHRHNRQKNKGDQ